MEAPNRRQAVSPTQDESQDTYSPVTGGPTTADATNEPLHHAAIPRHWGRYQFMRQLGEGGGGYVFLAYDPRLKRNVAVKFLKNESAQQKSALLREARAQARVDHENLCKIYEVGEIEGRLFITMPFLDGLTLGTCARRMNVEQKLQVLKGVADGVHAAHRSGLVHRDIKPGNIMVLEDEQGGFKPVVLDFGIAHMGKHGSEKGPDQAGTPGFMAPEQTKGDPALLDRRTDVYGLGATLHYLLKGMPPDASISAAETEERLANLEGIPWELGSVIRKCLQPDPGDRYGSAGALAADLNRYLDGEPVSSVSGNRAYRWRKKILKHRALFGLGLLALLAIATVIGVAAKRIWDLNRQAELARETTVLVKEIESLARYGYMAPHHDIRPDRDLLQSKMDQIRELANRVPSDLRGPADFALGLGFLAQGHDEDARRHLEEAWHSGHRDSRVAYALGLVHLGLYRRHLPEVHQFERTSQRTAYHRDLTTRYLDRARDFMSLVKGDEVTSPKYLQALLAYANGDYAEALAALSECREKGPWLFEIPELEGQIYSEWSDAAFAAGDEQAIHKRFESAIAAYDRALDIAPSNPNLHKSKSSAFFRHGALSVYAGEDFAEVMAKGLAQLDIARALLPGDGEVDLIEARFYRVAAIEQTLQGMDPTDHLRKAVDSVERALASQWEVSRSNRLLGLLHWRLAEHQMASKQNPLPELDAAVAGMGRVAPSDRDDRFFGTYARIYRTRASWRSRSGLDPCADFEASLDSYRQALLRKPGDLKHGNGIANCLMAVAEQPECDRDPVATVREAIDVLERALDRNPKHAVLLYQLGRAHLRVARGGLRLGTSWDPESATHGIEALREALKLNPKLSPAYNVLGWAQLLQARHDAESGRTQDTSFDAAEETYLAGLDRSPNNRLLHQNLAWTLYFRAKFSIREGNPPNDLLIRAETHTDRALELGTAMDALLCRASIARIRAEWIFFQKGDPEPDLKRARDQFQEMLEKDPDHGEAHRSLGRLFTLWAEVKLTAGENPGPLLARAERELDLALALGPENPYTWTAVARWALCRARSTGHLDERGPEALERALRLKPHLRSAHLLKTEMANFRSMVQEP
ncbi:Non-specific serine/threonine protein kinase [Sulfidibacter corallicola]|uniref:Protein kinase n=1 Tax=Sulfidibacter corallicola TaxID=2818388 RepID=A0A8A4U1B2_SULCO|nr:serine/threonine-protein kinase [Sulfidibacter corallicola]QTD52535.1 protein kinase [Sulfidibacter corallicola]